MADPEIAAEPERFAVPFVKAVVLAPDGRLLLQRRAKVGDPYHGFWELPGGKMRHGETAEMALGRELREEAGLTLVSLLGQPGVSPGDRFGRAARLLTPLAVVEVASGPGGGWWRSVGRRAGSEMCIRDRAPTASAEGDRHRYVTVRQFAARFLGPGARGKCATLDLTAMRQIIEEGRLENLV